MMQPFINSLTGLSIRYDFPSVIGPLFYFAYIFFFLTYLIITRRSTSSVVLVVFIIMYTLFMTVTGRVDESNISYIFKLLLPLILYLFVKNIRLDNVEYKRIINYLIYSVLIYALSAIISFLLGYHIQPGKGYYGLIYAGNDMIVLFILTLFQLSIMRRETLISEVVILIGYLLTLSKSIFLVFIAYLIKFVYISKTKPVFFIRSGVSVLLISLSFPFLISYFKNKAETYMLEFNSLSTFLSLDFSQISSFLTFGRSNYLEQTFIGYQRDGLDYIFGLGLNNAANLLKGKVGIEMDFFDALNVYGILGVLYLVSFYYLPMFRFKFKFTSNLIFSMLLLYSFFGGHFYNNPLVGVYYGILLGLLEHNNKNAVRENFEICVNN